MRYLIFILYSLVVTKLMLLEWHIRHKGLNVTCCHYHLLLHILFRGDGGRVESLLPPTSEAGVQFPAWPQVGRLVVACCWSTVYSTEP